jgi:signal transduction histidine kinase/CheY-like chemotaxis protein
MSIAAMTIDRADLQERVLVLAPTGRDGNLVEQMLARSDIRTSACSSMAQLCAELARGAGALFIAEEAFTPDGIGLLSRAIKQQAPWSDVPLIVSTAEGATTEARIDKLAAIATVGNVVIIERPVRILTMVVTVQSALRARRRQYQMRDLSNQVEHERAKLEALVMQLPVAVWITEGPELRVAVANRTCLDMIGGRPMIGEPLVAALPELDGTELLRGIRAVYQTGEAYDAPELALSFRGTDGSVREGYYRGAHRALRDGAGRVAGVVSVAFDLTDQVHARQLVESARADADQARAGAEAANRAKDQFLAMLGHELRNPLAPILTALELMRLREGQSVARERAIIDRQARHMASLVDDLLDVSRITRGKVALKREVIELGELIGRAVETAAPLLEQRRHELVTDVPPRTYFVDGDPPRLTQVFANIITNAAKYTDDEGRIRIEAVDEGDDVVVRISDSGRGISPEMLTQVFDLFAQERQNIDRSQGGLGLGLAIVRSLVEMHGGSVTVHSEGVGRGSEFAVRLPRVHARREPSPDAEPAPEEGATPVPELPQPERPLVLLVDDNHDAANMMAEILDLMGYDVHVAHDGAEALRLAERTGRPAAALLDIGLPVIDGYDLARRLRRLPGWNGVSFVAVTGYGQENDKQQSREAGFDAHLVKPIDPLTLQKTLERLHARS